MHTLSPRSGPDSRLYAIHGRKPKLFRGWGGGRSTEGELESQEADSPFRDQNWPRLTEISANRWLNCFRSFSACSRSLSACRPISNCPVDLDNRYLIFLGYRVRQYGDITAMKKIKNPVIHCAKPGSQFINAVSQQIGLGP